MTDRPAFADNLARLRRHAPAVTQLLIDLVEARIVPLIERAGFRPSPEAETRRTNEFGLVWGINELAFQDRAVASWPTIALTIDRSLEPFFKVHFCEIPRMPMMLDKTVLPREEANVAHSVRALLLRKGRRGSYKDQHFGASRLSLWQERAVERDVDSCAGLLARVASVDRSNFVASIERCLEPKFLFESWRSDSALRPNRSTG